MPSRILVVDDDRVVARTLIEVLAHHGHQVTHVLSGEEALEKLALHPHDLVLLDVRLPGMTGLELYRHLVASGDPIPTVLITAHQDGEGRRHALNAGVICYLTKPFNEDDLLGCIHSALGHRKNDGKGL